MNILRTLRVPRRGALLALLATLALWSLAPREAQAEYGDVVINNFSDAAGVRPVVFPHWFHRVPLPEGTTGALAPFGVLTLRARWRVEGGHTAGAVLAVSPGNDGAEGARTSDDAWERTTSSTWADLTLSLALTENLLRAVLLTPAAGVNATPGDYQRGNVRMGRIWFGAYNSSNSNTSGNRASIVNLSLHLSAAA